MLSKMIGFLSVADAEKARAFYGEKLGFTLLSEDPYALVFDANGTMLRLQKGRTLQPSPGTVLGWEVTDVAATIAQLRERGVTFEQYGQPFMKQDALGIWSVPNGDQVAWFKDPDGNTLSISSHAARKTSAGAA